MLGLLAVALGCSSPTDPTDVAASSGGSAEAAEVVSLTNAERQRGGLTALTASSALMQAAQIHAEQMVAAGEMAHSLPGARYPEPADRLAAVAYRWQAYGENVAYGQPTPVSALSSWMGSAGHRANILNGMFTEMGAGVARDAQGRRYWVQVFGRSR